MNDRHKMMYKEQMQMTPAYKTYSAQSKTMMASYPPVQQPAQPPSHMMSSGMMTSTSVQRHGMTSHAMATHGLPGQHVASMPTQEVTYVIPGYKTIPASPSAQPHTQAPVQAMYCVEQTGSIQSGKPPQRAPSYSQEPVPPHSARPGPQAYGSGMLPPSSSIRSGGAAPSGSIRTGTVGQVPSAGYLRPVIPENTVNSGIKVRPTYYVPPGSHASHPVVVPHSPSSLPPAAPQPPKTAPVPSQGGGSMPPQQQRRYPPQPAPQPQAQPPMQPHQQPPSPRVMSSGAAPLPPQEGFGGAPRSKPPPPAGVVNGALDLTCMTETPGPPPPAKSGDAPLDLSVKVKKRPSEPGEIERLSPPSKKPRSQFAPSQFAPPSSPVLDLRSPEPPLVPRGQVGMHAASPQAAGSVHRARNAYDSSPHPGDVGRRGSVGSVGSAGSSPSPTVKMTPPEMKHGVPPSLTPQQPPQLIKASPGMYLGYPGAPPTDRKPSVNPQQSPQQQQQQSPQSSLYPPHSPRHSSYSPLASPGAQSTHAQFKAGMQLPGSRGGTSPRSTSGGVVRGGEREVVVQRNGFPGFMEQQTSASGVIRSGQDVMGPPSSPQVSAMKSESAQMRMVQQQQQQQHPQHQQRLPHQPDPIHHHHHQQQQQQQHQQQQAQQHHHHAQQQQQQLPHHPQQYSHDVHYQRQMQQHHQQQQQQQHQHQQQQHHQQAQQEEMQKAKTYGAAEAPHSRGYPAHPHPYQHPSPTSPSVTGYPGKGVPSGAMGHPHVPASSPHHLSAVSPHHLSPSMRDPSLGLAPSSQQRQQATSAQGMSRPHAMPAAQSVPALQQRSAGGAPVSMQAQPIPRSTPGQGQPHPSYSNSARVPQHAGSGPMYREEPGMARVGSSASGHHPRSAEQSPSTQMYPGMYPSRSHLSPGANSAGVPPQLSAQQPMVHGASQSQPHPKSSPGGQGLPAGSGHLPISQHPSPAVGRSSSAERGAVPVSVNGPASAGMSGHPPSSGSVAAYHVPPGGAPSLHPSATGIGAFQSPANGLPSQMYQTGLAAPMGQPHVPGATSQTLPPRQASYDRQATGYDRQQAMRSPSTTRAPSSSAGGFRPAASYGSHPASSHAAVSSSMVSQERSLCQVAEMHSNMAAASGARMRPDLLEQSVHAQRPKPLSDPGVTALTSTNVVSVTSVTVTSSQALSSLSAPRTTVTQALTSSVMSSTASPSSVVSAGSVTSVSPALKAEEVGVAGPRPKVDPAKLSQLSQPLEIAIPGTSSSGGGSSSSRPATDLPPPTGTAPKCAAKQPPPAAGPSSASSTSSSPKPMSRKHRLMTAFNKDEDLRRMQPPANPPDPSKASTSSSGDFKAPTVSPSSPPSPKMPILSPQQAPAPQTSPMHNEPPTLDPPATSEKRALMPVVKDRHGMFPHASGMDKARSALQPKPASSAAFRGMAKPAVPSSVLTAGPSPKSQVRTSVVMSVSSTLEAGLTSSPIVADSAVVASVSESTPGSVPSAPVGPAPQPSEGQCTDKGRSSTDAPSSSSSSTSFSSGGAPVGPVDMLVSKDDMSCNGRDGSGGGGSVFSSRRNSLPEHNYRFNKNIPVANVAPFQHANASKDGRELVVGPDEDCSMGQAQDPNSGPQVGSPADVKLELEEEEKNEGDEKDVPSPTGNQSRRQSPRKVQLMRNLMRSKRFLGTPLKLRLLRTSQSQDYPDMDDSIAVDKASAAGRRKKQQQQRRQQQQQRQQRRRRRQQQQQQQQQEKSDGGKGKRSLLDDLSWPASKKSRDPGDLLLDDPALLGREERALRRAIIEIDKMESKGDPRDSRVATRRTAVSNANRKAQELKKRALGDRRRARDLSRRPLRSCTLRQRRFSDFEPTPHQRRPRRRRCQTRYNRNAAYEKELKREESRKALKRRQRERMRAGQTAHSDSDDTTDGEREEEGEEDEDEDLERVSGSGSAEDEGSKQGESEDGSGGPGGRWEIKVAGTAGAKRALRSGRQSRGGLMMKLQWRRGAERKTNFGRPIRRRLELSPDSSDTGNAHHQQRYPATGSRRRQGKQSRSRPESDHELLFTEESSDSDQSQVSGRLPFQDVAEDSNSVPAPPELRKLAVNKNSGETILHKATKPGYEEVALYCLRTRSVEVNARDNAGYTPLHECCVRGNLTVAWYLILHGADVNCCSQDGIRPVHDAVENEHVEIVRLLLSCGADPSIATYAGKTPLKIARSQVMRDLIRGYLADLNGWECEGEEEQEEEEEEEVPWLFQGSSDFMDPAECSGFDVFADIPSDPEDEPEEMFDDDLTAAVPTYDLQVAGSSEPDRFVLVEEAARELGVREEEVMRLCGRDGPCLRREEFLQLTSHCVLRPRQPKTERVRLLRLSTLKQHAEALSAMAGKQGATAGSGAAPASGKHSPARQGYAPTKASSVGTPGANKTLPNTRHTPNGRQAGDEQGAAPGLTSNASFPPGPGHRATYGKTRVVSGAGGQGPPQYGCAPLGKTSPGSGGGPHSQMFKPIKESPKKQAGPMGPYPPGARKNFRDDLSVSLQKLNTTKVPQPRRPQASAPSGRPTWTTTSPSTSTLPMSSTSLTSSSFSKSSPGPLSSSRSASLPSSSAATAMQSAFSTSSSAMPSHRMTMSLGGKQPGGAHVGPALTPGMKSHSYPLQGRSATAGSGAKGPLTLLSGKPTISTSRTAMTTFGQPSVVLSNSRISSEGRSAFVSRQGVGTGRPLALGPGSARQEVGQDPRGVRERGAAGEGQQAKEDVYKFKVGTVPEDCFELATMKVLNGGSHTLKAPGNQP